MPVTKSENIIKNSVAVENVQRTALVASVLISADGNVEMSRENMAAW
jgi:hypothetical protein